MSDVLSIVVNGVSVTIDKDVFVGFTKESADNLRKQDTLKAEFKDIVERAADETKLAKKDVSKYLKSRWSASTKVPKAQGELFEALDNVVDN